MRKIIPAIAIYLCVISIIFFCILSMPDKISDNEAKNTENMVYYSIIRYYAIEGHYPETIEELDRYGLHYNKDRFMAGYQNLGENIMPDITIIDRSRYEK